MTKSNSPEYYTNLKRRAFANELQANVEELGRNIRGQGDPPWDEIVSAVISLEKRIANLEISLEE